MSVAYERFDIVVIVWKNHRVLGIIGHGVSFPQSATDPHNEVIVEKRVSIGQLAGLGS